MDGVGGDGVGGDGFGNPDDNEDDRRRPRGDDNDDDGFQGDVGDDPLFKPRPHFPGLNPKLGLRIMQRWQPPLSHSPALRPVNPSGHTGACRLPSGGF